MSKRKNRTRYWRNPCRLKPGEMIVADRDDKGAIRIVIKRLKVLPLLFWWFMTFGSGSNFSTFTQGPFASREQCEYVRSLVKDNHYTTPCWDDGRK
jgi:hypothetical protein